jgi:hypothetical protein
MVQVLVWVNNLSEIVPKFLMYKLKEIERNTLGWEIGGFYIIRILKRDPSD